MIFERTANGIRNENLFYGVEFVVYCEGRESEGTTHDEMFWSKVLSTHGVKCKCKSRGSSSSIIALIESSQAEAKDGVAFALDRDYWNFYGFPAKGNNILYTHGYSWENDILVSIDAEVLFGLFAPVQFVGNIQASLNDFLLRVSECGNIATRHDVTNIQSNQSLFDREKPLSIIVGSGDDLRFDDRRLVERSNEIASPALIADEILREVNWLKDFYGKACTRLVYRWFVDKSKGASGRSSVPYDVFVRMCITLMKFDADTCERDSYYRNLAAKLSSARVA